MNITKLALSNPPITPEYSTICPWNSDNTRLLLLASNPGYTLDHFILCDGDGQYIRDLPIAANQQPRWSRTDPRILYYVQGSSLIRCSPGLMSYVTIEHAFTEYESINSLGKSDISEDGDHFVFQGISKNRAPELFVDSLKDGVQSILSPMVGLNSIYITASNYMVQGTLTGSYARGELIIQGQVPHMDTFHDYLVYCSSNDAVLNKNAVVMVDIFNPGDKHVLMEFDWAYAMHISCCDQQFCCVSVYDPKNVLPMQIWQVFYDGQPKVKLCETGGIYRDYSSQPHATISRDGTRIVFAVDNGKTIGTSMLVLDPVPIPPVETWIDYRPYQDQEFILRPQPDGSIKVFSRKVK
jgi:hypothetical protein